MHPLFSSNLIWFIELPSWTVTYSGKLERGAIDSSPEAYRARETPHSFAGSGFELLKCARKHRLYVMRGNRALED